SQRQFMDLCRQQIKKVPKLKGVLLDFSNQGLAPRRSFAVEFAILGSRWSVLKEKAALIQKDLRATNLVTDLDIDYHEGMPEVRVIPDRARASAFGVAMSELVASVGAAMGGLRQGSFTNDVRRYDVRLRLQEGQWKDASSLSQIQVRNN